MDRCEGGVCTPDWKKQLRFTDPSPQDRGRNNVISARDYSLEDEHWTYDELLVLAKSFIRTMEKRLGCRTPPAGRAPDHVYFSGHASGPSVSGSLTYACDIDLEEDTQLSRLYEAVESTAESLYPAVHDTAEATVQAVLREHSECSEELARRMVARHIERETRYQHELALLRQEAEEE